MADSRKSGIPVSDNIVTFVCQFYIRASNPVQGFREFVEAALEEVVKVTGQQPTRRLNDKDFEAFLECFNHHKTSIWPSSSVDKPLPPASFLKFYRGSAPASVVYGTSQGSQTTPQAQTGAKPSSIEPDKETHHGKEKPKSDVDAAKAATAQEPRGKAAGKENEAKQQASKDAGPSVAKGVEDPDSKTVGTLTNASSEFGDLDSDEHDDADADGDDDGDDDDDGADGDEDDEENDGKVTGDVEMNDTEPETPDIDSFKAPTASVDLTGEDSEMTTPATTPRTTRSKARAAAKAAAKASKQPAAEDGTKPPYLGQPGRAKKGSEPSN